jgi:hypothetical protein
MKTFNDQAVRRGIPSLLTPTLSDRSTGGRGRTGIVLLLLCLVSGPVSAQNDDNKKVYKAEYQAAFKNTPKGIPGLVVFGTEPERVKYEDGALRITLPEGTLTPRAGEGVATDFGIKGDFEITTSYEILHGQGSAKPAGPNQPRRAANYPTDLKLVIVPHERAERGSWHRSNQNRASIGRQYPYADFGPQGLIANPPGYVADITQWTPPAGAEPGPSNLDPLGRPNFTRVEPHARSFKLSNSMTGRLRLVRTGANVSFLFSDAEHPEFTSIHEAAFGAKDLKNVRILASTGDVGAALDVRITELRIRAEAFPKWPAAPFGPFELTQQDLEPPMPKWMKILIGMATLTAFAIGAAAWRLVRSRRAASGQAVAVNIDFHCVHCGTPLKVKADHAGKKAKCGKCEHVVDVPGPAPSSEKLA